MLNLNKQLEEALKREGQLITDYFTKEYTEVVFRKPIENNGKLSRLKLFYRAEANIGVGTIFSYEGNNYLVINQNSVESTCYLKSTAERCTESLSVDKKKVPVVVEELQSALPVGNNMIQVVSGYTKIYTTDNDITQSIDINDRYDCFGSRYKVVNNFRVGQLLHLYLERVAGLSQANHQIVLDYSFATEYNVGDSTRIYATTYTNDIQVEGQTVQWSSSNENVATISAEGNIQFVGAGSVAFTATWVEHSVSQATNTVTVQDVIPVDFWTMEIKPTSGNANIYIDFSKTYEFKAYRNGVEEHITGWQWELLPDTYNIAKSYTASTAQLKLTCPDDNKLIDKPPFLIHAYNPEYGLDGTLSVQCIGFW